ncbi:MAG: hypothetical protein DRI61_01995 [Chloroflexi bacterium]|nr:MAG: hypothetical protein DRI61_01995 [Chloroflexota bacterium]
MTGSDILTLSNFIISSGIVLVAFSLLAYIATYNFANPVARAFCAMMTFVILVYAGDVVIPKVKSIEAALMWLRLQWLGIAFIPAAYLHFSDALLRTVNSLSLIRRWLVIGAYILGLLFCVLALLSDVLVYDGHFSEGLVYLAPGPIFPLFTCFFILAYGASLYSLYRARQKALTSTTRRRMTYLMVAFIGPGLGVFPYLLISKTAAIFSAPLVLFLSVVGNLTVALMLVVMAYTVAYYGVLTPDRVIKHRLIHYLLRGPFVGLCVIGVILLLSNVDQILGLPRDTVIVFAVVGLIVVLQISINKAKPFIDRIIYSRDKDEVAWIQELDERLLTTTDLQQFLESVLVALCEFMKVHWGFVGLIQGSNLMLEAKCGPLLQINEIFSGLDVSSLRETLSSDEGSIHLDEDLRVYNRGFWLIPLRSSGGDLLGILALDSPAEDTELTLEEVEVFKSLIHRVSVALEDRLLQQRVFEALRHIIPEIERIQRWRATPYSAPAQSPEVLADLSSPEYRKWVKEALAHYWGGPKLTKSPLIKLRIVEKAMKEYGGNPTKALRAVLREAIEALKPEGEYPDSSLEWLLYNILDMRFIQGKRPREIANRLAISESDLYRKQRIAIEQVTKILAEMERREAYADTGK